MPRDLPTRAHPARLRPVAWTLATVALVGALTACTPDAAPAPTDGSAPDKPSPTSTAPAQPELVPDGTAADNLPLFRGVTSAVWASEDRAAGRAYIDALVAAGFDKSAMQVTNDQSTVGNAAESIQFSVLWGQECLVGQVGPSTGDPVTVIVPVLAEGTCLVGHTRPIDW